MLLEELWVVHGCAACDAWLGLGLYRPCRWVTSFGADWVTQELGAAPPSFALHAAQFQCGGSLFTPHALSARASPRGRTKSPICYSHRREQLNARAQAMSLQDRIVEKASRVVPLGITSYRRD